MDDIRNMEGGISGEKTPPSSGREDMLHLDELSEKLPATLPKSPNSNKTDEKLGEEYMLTRTNGADWVLTERLTVISDDKLTIASPVSTKVIQTENTNLRTGLPMNLTVQKQSRHSQRSKNRVDGDM